MAAHLSGQVAICALVTKSHCEGAQNGGPFPAGRTPGSLSWSEGWEEARCSYGVLAGWCALSAGGLARVGIFWRTWSLCGGWIEHEALLFCITVTVSSLTPVSRTLVESRFAYLVPKKDHPFYAPGR
ncbi:hypothetical protein H1C71_038421 [Ictidomys tridecemlineatus]|nr:hypothetical protein H1C71_038421 [Ictidomys tridecemlineatus]KAG3276251.1 hypothetical protein H1C71_038421 [Ictidomys tridecemlineatus]